MRAIEVDEAGGQRFFVVSGYYTLKVMVDSIRKTHPELEAKLPENPVDDLPEDVYGFDNSKARDILGVSFRGLEECVGDTVTSLLGLGGGKL